MSPTTKLKVSTAMATTTTILRRLLISKRNNVTLNQWLRLIIQKNKSAEDMNKQMLNRASQTLTCVQKGKTIEKLRPGFWVNFSLCFILKA